ncbi:hypothetical protein HMPREF9999_00969 [Alloprevotella sp. oral taxon 473 str. F0040]|nr:hypothetical protein HMPREF9999_00969 [Alloprevotella sp. oral taxon 473 str. F0040]
MTILSLDISFVVRELTFEVGEQKILLQKERELSLVLCARWRFFSYQGGRLSE